MKVDDAYVLDAYVLDAYLLDSCQVRGGESGKKTGKKKVFECEQCVRTFKSAQ